MGEYADLAISDQIDDWRGSGVPRGAYGWGERPPTKTCRRCGKGALHWRNTGTKAAPAWRLHHWTMFGEMKEPAYVLHVCGFQSDGTPVGKAGGTAS